MREEVLGFLALIGLLYLPFVIICYLGQRHEYKKGDIPKWEDLWLIIMPMLNIIFSCFIIAEFFDSIFKKIGKLDISILYKLFMIKKR